jgi:hypothetical protein
VRHFISDKSVATEILEISTLPRENSGLPVHHVLEAAQKHNSADKIKVISRDNTNINFTGLKRKGKNNVSANLHEKLNTEITHVGCVQHTSYTMVHILFLRFYQQMFRQFWGKLLHTAAASLSVLKKYDLNRASF